MFFFSCQNATGWRLHRYASFELLSTLLLSAGATVRIVHGESKAHLTLADDCEPRVDVESHTEEQPEPRLYLRDAAATGVVDQLRCALACHVPHVTCASCVSCACTPVHHSPL